ncbi:MAG: hypothetical protein LDL41_01735, partial [Coleofasciculus sp. S288]|nr:hypothetical protein [Coleofasciculus sp. S288]
NNTLPLNWVTLDTQEEKRVGEAERRRGGDDHTLIGRDERYPSSPLVEANGWVINDKGEVILVAFAPHTTPNNPLSTPVTCPLP